MKHIDLVSSTRHSLALAVVCLSFMGVNRMQAQVPTWTAATVPAAVPADPNNVFTSIAYNGTKFLASGLEMNVISSTDGVNWNYDGRMSAATVVSVFSVAWIPHLNKWVAASNVNLATNAVIYSSSDGLTWTPTGSGITNPVSSFATDGTTVIGSVNSGGRLLKSTNLGSWSLQTLGIGGIGSLFSIIYVPSASKWVAVGGGGGIITSPDGNTWTKQTGPTNITGIIRAVAYGNGRYVVVANAAGLAGWSTDAVTWNNASTGSAQGLTRITFVNGVFVAVGTNGAIVSSPDGATWSPAHNSGTTDQNISDVVANGTGPSAKVVAVGGSNTPIIRHIDASLLNTVSGPVAPTVTTAAQSAVTHNSATLGGNVTADGGASVTERGIVWGLAANPTTANNKVQMGSGTGAFSATVNGLPPGTPINVRAYAINSVNTSYGANISFNTLPAVAVTSLTRVGTAVQNGGFVFWNLTFASPVTGLSASNFTLSGAAAAGSGVASPGTSTGGLVWNIPVGTGSTDGTLTLNLANSTGLSTAITTTLPFAGDSITMDKTPPTVLSVVRQTPTGQNTNATTVTFRVTYSEPVNLTAPLTTHYQVVPVGGSTIVGTVTGVTGADGTATRDVTVNLTSGTGEFKLRVLD